MLGVLKRGEILSVMGDRLLGSERSAVAVDFLGAPVRLPFSAYKMASVTGAPIGVLLSAKTGADRYELRLAKTLRVPGGLGRGGRAFADDARRFADGHVERARLLVDQAPSRPAGAGPQARAAALGDPGAGPGTLAGAPRAREAPARGGEDVPPIERRGTLGR